MTISNIGVIRKSVRANFSITDGFKPILSPKSAEKVCL